MKKKDLPLVPLVLAVLIPLVFIATYIALQSVRHGDPRPANLELVRQELVDYTTLRFPQAEDIDSTKTPPGVSGYMVLRKTVNQADVCTWSFCAVHLRSGRRVDDEWASGDIRNTEAVIFAVPEEDNSVRLYYYNPRQKGFFMMDSVNPDQNGKVSDADINSAVFRHYHEPGKGDNTMPKGILFFVLFFGGCAAIEAPLIMYIRSYRRRKDEPTADASATPEPSAERSV